MDEQPATTKQELPSARGEADAVLCLGQLADQSVDLSEALHKALANESTAAAPPPLAAEDHAQPDAQLQRLQRLGETLLALSPKDREQSLKIAAALMAAKAKRIAALTSRATSELSTSPASQLPPGDLDICSAQLSHLGIDLTSELHKRWPETLQGTMSSSSDKTEISTVPPSAT